jgi:RNA polymerase sigma factor (TIGR02999 family)
VEDARNQVTELLAAVGNGDSQAAERLWRAVNDELHGIAKAQMTQEGHRHDLQTTILVQEAYLRLAGHDGSVVPADRRQFFAAAARTMREFLVDCARKRATLKRGGDRTRGALQEVAADLARDPAEVLALNEALDALREHDPRKADIVEVRYIIGLTIEETAKVLGVSPRTVSLEWQVARAWLHRELAE